MNQVINHLWWVCVCSIDCRRAVSTHLILFSFQFLYSFLVILPSSHFLCYVLCSMFYVLPPSSSHTHHPSSHHLPIISPPSFLLACCVLSHFYDGYGWWRWGLFSPSHTHCLRVSNVLSAFTDKRDYHIALETASVWDADALHLHTFPFSHQERWQLTNMVQRKITIHWITRGERKICTRKKIDIFSFIHEELSLPFTRKGKRLAMCSHFRSSSILFLLFPGISKNGLTIFFVERSVCQT